MSDAKKVTEYIRSEPPHARKALLQVRALVRKLVPRATEKLAWGMPTFCLEGNLLHYAAFTSHLSLFPGSDAIRHFEKQLSRFTTSKGTIQVPYGEPIPVALFTRIVKFCVARNLELAAAKAAKKAAKKKKKRKSP